MSATADTTLPQLARGVTGTPVVLEGRVVFGPVAVGSKQQHVGPVIVGEDNVAVRIFILGDNPFSHGLAKRWAGHRVSVPGEWKNGVVEVEEHDIALLDAPATLEE